MIDKKVGGGVDRSKIPAGDFAGKDRSFPIVMPKDVADAASSIGRAGTDNYDADTIKANIIKIAKRKGEEFVMMLPKAWTESAQFELPLEGQALTEALKDKVAKLVEAELAEISGKWRFRPASTTITEVGKTISASTAAKIKACIAALEDIMAGTGMQDDPAVESAVVESQKTKCYRIQDSPIACNCLYCNPPSESAVEEGVEKVVDSESIELREDGLSLLEKGSVRPDGTVDVRIIRPGKGTSGYYSPEVLKRDGPKAFTKGLHMYIDHPTVTEARERPERSVKDLALVLAEDSRYEDNHPEGEGLYAKARVKSGWRDFVNEYAADIGTSIRASGSGHKGMIDGKRMRIVDAIHPRENQGFPSVDLVTVAGAGGKILELMESVRYGIGSEMDEAATGREEDEESIMDETIVQELQEAAKAAKAETARLREEVAQLREGKLLQDARAVVTRELARTVLPEITQKRLVDALSGNPPVKDNLLDEPVLIETVKARAASESEYLAQLLDSGKVRGMGSTTSAPDPKPEELRAATVASFKRLGFSESAAIRAAEGRVQ